VWTREEDTLTIIRNAAFFCPPNLKGNGVEVGGGKGVLNL